MSRSRFPSPRMRRLVAVSVALALAACAGQTPVRTSSGVQVPPPCNAALCNITQNTWQYHIDPRHCQGTCVMDNKSVFVAGHCGSLANAVAFCQTLMGRADCLATQQPGTRVAYTATLAATVGTNRNNVCNNTDRGTVIYDTGTGQVVTQFPGDP